MHGRQKSPPLEAPPLVAPPVVASSPAEQTGPSPRSIVDRILRDFKIGGVCLIVGLLVGQSRWLQPDPTLTSTIAESADLMQRVAVQSSRRNLRRDDNPSNRELPQDRTQSFDQPSPFASASDVPEAVPLNDSPIDDAPLPSVAVVSDPQSAADVAVESESDPLKTTDEAYASTTTQEETESEWAPEAVDPSPPIADYVSTSLESIVPPTQTLMTAATCEAGTCQENMESLGTSVMWADTPAEAYRMADERHQLVFLIHVSGNFEIPGFT